MSYVRKVDPEIADAIQNDIRRQEYNVQLIASENYASRAVLEAQVVLRIVALIFLFQRHPLISLNR